MLGYCGKFLKVNLTKGETKVQKFDERLARKFIGGVGFAARLIYDEVPSGIDAYDPKNILVFAVGPLTATAWPASASCLICSKSPMVRNPETLVGGWGETRAGGPFGPRLKSSGFDAIIVTGKAEKPVYLDVNDGAAKLKDASHLRGKGTNETDIAIKKDLGDPKAAIACIGPAGEKLVRFACVMGSELHPFGRTGLGAVMGSKNLKAISTRGEQKTELAYPEKLEELCRSILKPLLEHPHTVAVKRGGTADHLLGREALGITPIQNWRGGSWTEEAEKISGDAFNEKYGRNVRTCPGCPIGCHGNLRVEKKMGPLKPFSDARPEYETIAMFGTNLLVDDPDVISACNHICNDYGMDTLSAGQTAAFAYECYEKGIITEKDTDGLKLEWGNRQALVWLTWKIANREGIGDLLAEGSLLALRKLNKGCEEWLIEVKGEEFPGCDPRGLDGLAVEYAASTKGAHHLDSHGFISDLLGGDESIGLGALPLIGAEGKGRAYALGTCISTCVECVGVCLMATICLKFATLSQALNYATGFNLGAEEFLEVGERITDLKRAFNYRCGLTSKHDYLPKRVVALPRPSGGAKGHLPNLEVMLKDYYDFFKWDPKTGKPKKERLIELGLEDIAKDIWR